MREVSSAYLNIVFLGDMGWRSDVKRRHRKRANDRSLDDAGINIDDTRV